MAKPGRKLGYRTPNSLLTYPILENLYLMGYSSDKAAQIVRELGYTCSNHTAWRRWKEFERKHPEALLRYGQPKREVV
ncbi:hypothetical protein [Meiothermus ruber]|jgi:hypothetical protein|uniref:Uncharacterized protein n=1 Tax=Meiothermus ruber (strain ATCC 35948 / DSM 1279 / VKM B-1258 / 21) TaxID=504728 RepID=D3PL71_MEIRD|nr:hypothetical protein [Meiothermus ruber]GIW32591.1 MAG: hypothetical protein KatS3mg071_2765 [Meiothermus sp.]ADD26967.1 hypothetical protein Mrub_0187 [Meiothermus ruber DSM 1279]AGK03421.1 hypothetical protein K649_00545 [Meiothermus ruber DSM 1279]MCL6530806.1 hypothetical protein [Meiothermus ruber]GAO73884.1 putative uncharacterized protein [Meiothermus ruber H328]